LFLSGFSASCPVQQTDKGIGKQARCFAKADYRIGNTSENYKENRKQPVERTDDVISICQKALTQITADSKKEVVPNLLL
jgi:DNA repair protein RadC